MRDLIDRDELIDMLKSAIAIMKSLSIRIGADNDPVIQMEIKTYTDILKHVKKMSPAEQERKTGRWIQKEKGAIVTSYECSECGRIVRDDTGYDVYTGYPYCHCGAKMNKETE